MKKILALIALTCIPGVVSAAPLTWSYSGTCSSLSLLCGANTSAPITGSLAGDPSSGGSSLFFDASEVTSFSFSWAGGSFSGPPSVTGGYILDGSNDIIAGLMTFDLSLLVGGVKIGFVTIEGWKDTAGTKGIGPGSYSVVPEPGSLALLGLGLAGLGLVRRKRSA